ncbi:sigma-54-dependent Fis family transcriptional regulator [bacterium]|nr:sigma-54-dependent Fis family transcriptional regulator [bacterium]
MLEILLVGDQAKTQTAAKNALSAAAHRVTVASTEARARSLLDSRVFDVVISDVNMKKGDGLALFRHVHAISPATDVILMTDYGTVADAVAALKEGAYDYVMKPFDIDVIGLRLERIAERRRLAEELASAREAAARVPETPIIGRTPSMARLTERIGTMAASDAAVLITGETGTGKELVAHSLHERSPRAAKPFVAVNCAAFPETLLEAELFGHERGAFTGASRKREGRFKAAHGGTLFIDEVAEMPVTAQLKLLRVLEDGVVEPLGTNEAIHVDVRVITATHRNLKERIAQGIFREDLYYRLKVLDIAIPPLRERRGDLPLLVQHFLLRSHRPGAAIPVISPRAWAALGQYSFPGNVRELEHCVEHAVVLAQGKEIDIDHLPSEIAGTAAPDQGPDGSLRSLAQAAHEFEREYLVRALTLAGGKKALAAKTLGISRKNLWEKLKAHGISDPEPED